MDAKRIDSLSPIVIGGVGGSGTRLIASLLMVNGYYMGTDLNDSNDNLWFTFLFKRANILKIPLFELMERYQIFLKATFGFSTYSNSELNLLKTLKSGDSIFSSDWYNSRYQSILKNENFISENQKWGWKEPNSHIILANLTTMVPRMKYIHVIRNGLDMAYSINQNQLRLWGKSFIGTNDVTPANSLKYWCEVHRNVLRHSKSLNERFLLLNYDNLCLQPDKSLSQLFEFLGIRNTNETMEAAKRMIKIPSSIGRYQKYGLQTFEGSDLKYVESLGFLLNNA